MIIRDAAATDAPAIADLVNTLVRDTTVTFTTIEKEPADIAADIAALCGAYLVAEQDGRIMGAASFFPFRSGPGYARTQEHSIVVASDGWGQGVGRALMQQLTAKARARDVHSLIAGVSGENKAGLAFHARLGFVRVGHLPQVGHKFGRWLDLILMQKILSDAADTASVRA